MEEQRAAGVHRVQFTDGGEEIRLWNGSNWDPRPVADFWPKAFAFVLDLVFFILLLGTIILIIATVDVLVANDTITENTPNIVWTLLFLAVWLAYFTLFYAKRGATLGMRILKLEIVDFRTGNKLSVARALLRAVVLFLGFACGILFVIYIVTMATSRLHRGVQDELANSVVLQRFE